MFPQLEQLVQQNKTEQDLKRGSSNKPAVTELQTALYQSGFGAELKWAQFGADGSYGNGTSSAVKAFSTKVNLSSTGESVSQDVCTQLLTRSAEARDLRQVKRSLTQLKRGSGDKAGVKALQRLLNQLGYGEQLNWAKFKDDGAYGGGTTAAVKAFGQKEGIATDGEQLNETLGQKLVEKISAFFGAGWAEVQDATNGSGANRRVASKAKGTYVDLFPVGGRNYDYVEKVRTKTREEDARDENKKEVVRPYRYEFEKATYKLKKESLEFDHMIVKKFGASNKLISSFFYPETHKRKINKTNQRIILHFTAGQASGDIKTLSKENFHVSTPYIIGRDGTIYRMFSPRQWSHHLGIKVDEFGLDADPCSIGIEISNYGPLKENGHGELMTIYDSVYCRTKDTEGYVKLDHPYRGYEYYASYTPEQYEATIMLLRYLTETFDIKRKFLPTDKTLESQGKYDQIARYSKYKSGAEAEAFKGICSHVNYRPTGKWDIGPAFDWDKVIAGVTADSFAPEHLVASRGIFDEVLSMDESTQRAEDQGLDYGNMDESIYGPDGPEVDI